MSEHTAEQTEQTEEEKAESIAMDQGDSQAQAGRDEAAAEEQDSQEATPAT